MAAADFQALIEPNEIGREQVLSDVIQWLDHQVEATPLLRNTA